MSAVWSRRCAGVGGLVVLCVLMVCLGVGVSVASASEPWWRLSGGARPSLLPRGGEGEVVVSAENYGDANANGVDTPIRIVDHLPAGLRVEAVAGGEPHNGAGGYLPMSCEAVNKGEAGATVSCSYEASIVPYTELELRIAVQVSSGAQSGEVNQSFVSGGGAATATLSRPVNISTSPEEAVPFGLQEWGLWPESEGGSLDAQAGSHPFQVTGSFVLNQGPDLNLNTTRFKERPKVLAAGLAKDIITKLPAGLVGDPTPIPRCTLGQFLNDTNNQDECPADSAVGVAAVTINLASDFGMNTFIVPIFNLEPYAGEPARFGFFIPSGNVPVVLDTSVRTGEKYAITVGSTNITETASLLSVRTTFWGDPESPAHNQSRGWACLYESIGLVVESGQKCVPSESTHSPAFLTLPTNCEERMQASVEMDQWNDPAEEEHKQVVQTTEPMDTLVGCNSVPFSPTITASPTTTFTASPSGLDFNLFFKNEGLINAEGVAQSTLKNTTVVLPEDLTINPSAGVGLAGCSEHQYEEETLQPKTEQEKREHKGCPDEAKLGTVTIETPLLTQPIDGNIYIAQPYENPFPEPENGHPGGTLVALYIVARNPETGVLVKLAGKVTPNPATGQLTTTFKEAPQLPFDHFNFHFREGAQAPLITPATCGNYTTQALLSPWSEPLSASTDTSSFTLTGDCPAGGAPPFKPGIVAGMVNNNAGAFGELYVDLSRTDQEQEISEFSTVLPPGASGIITGIPYCSEAQIEEARHKTGAQEEANPSCPAASQIGETQVGTGVGSVLAYVPGKVYLAGPFRSAPFSIVSVTSAKVGPFDLGTVVLRFGLEINPYTAQVSVSPSSSEPIPTIIDGIVTHVRDIKVYINRHDFTINPTSCEKTSLTSTLHAHEGASAIVSSSFQSVNCASLKFEPKVTASVSGKVTKANGTSFHLTVSKPAVQGEQADLKKFKVELPVQLPSRLTTLQKACTSAQFEANPAGCPAASVIGFMKTHTPLLPVPVEGPMYFVSHGGEAWPSLEIVLQGDGVKVILIGQTHISGSGITSSTFNAIPDVPFSSAEVELHNGPYSALTGLGSLCAPTTTTTVKKKVTVKVKVHGHVRKKTVTKKVKQTKATSLLMPTEMVAQNGAAVYTTTHVAVSECPQSKTAAVKKHAKKARKGKRKKGGHGKKGR